MLSVMEFIFILFAGVVSFILYMKWNRQYWRRKNVPYIEANSLWGNIENPVNTKTGFNVNMKQIYDQFRERRHKHGGIYMFFQHAYMPTDPDLIKHILVKDFSHFFGQGIHINAEKEPLTAHLGNLRGEEWRNMRAQLTHIFTSGKMKMMFNTLLECGVPMIQHIDKLCQTGKALDIKEILSCYTTDVIGSCAFGLDCKSFKDPDAEFRRFGRDIFKPSVTIALGRLFSLVIPSFREWFYVRIMKKETEEFFINAVKSIIDYRETNNFKRNDFIQLFVEINERARENGEQGLSLNQVAAQSFVFFAGGFETSATTMTFCLHELAFSQGIQDKLREEVRENMKKHDGKLTYDTVMDMKYMDIVLNESLRKYPPTAVLNRLCNKNFQVPNTDVVIEEGTRVFISILGLHRDEEYYPSPDKFDPERFNEENKAKRPPFTFLPFGEGPRMCIGFRFALMIAKIGLSMILNNYRILPAKGENYNIEFDPRSFVLSKKGPILLTAEKMTV